METDNMISSLKLFNEKAELLKNHSFTEWMIQNKSGFTVSMKIGEEVKVENRWPNEDSIHAFVLTYRFFVQKREDCSIRKIAKIYEKLEISPEIKESFIKTRKVINMFLDRGTHIPLNIITQSSSKNFTYREIQEIFLYGNLAHADPRFKRTYDYLMSKQIVSSIVKNEFICLLVFMVRAIHNISILNDKVLSEIS